MAHLAWWEKALNPILHEAAGVVDDGGTLFVNASSLAETGMRPGVVVTWEGERMAVM